MLLPTIEVVVTLRQGLLGLAPLPLVCPTLSLFLVVFKLLQCPWSRVEQHLRLSAEQMKGSLGTAELFRGAFKELGAPC